MEAEVRTDEEVRGKYRQMLLDVGFDPEVAQGVTDDVFGAVEEAQQELARQ